MLFRLKFVVIVLCLVFATSVFAVNDSSKYTFSSQDVANAKDIRDIKAPLYFPSKLKPFLIAVLIIIIMSALILLFLFLKKKKEVDEMPPPRPPHEIALALLEMLERKDLITKGKVKEFYTELSYILRRYIEDSFSLRAPEMTTEEFLVTVKDSTELTSEHKRLLREFLAHCDLVKFAKYGPTQGESHESFKSVKDFVEQTKAAEEETVETAKQ